MSRYDTFIVRIWTDSRDKTHGQIKHVATHEDATFSDLNQAMQFILEHIQRSGEQDRIFLKNEGGEVL